MTRVLAAYARFASRRPRAVLAVVLAIVVVFGFCARNVRLDNNFAALFATSSDDARFRDDYRRQFGPDDGLLVAVLTTHDPSPAFVDLLERTTDATSRIDAMARVNSLTNADLVTRTPDGQLVVGPAVGRRSHLGGTFADRVAVATGSRLGAGQLVTPDGTTFLVVGEMKAGHESYESVVGPAEEFERTVRDAVATSGLPVEMHFSGVAFTRIAAIHTMEGDLLRLSPLATLLMAILLWLFFRRVIAVIAPLMAIGASVIITAGIVGLAGDDLNQVTIIYPILLMGVVVAAATHLIHRFYRERAAGRSAEEAGRITIEVVTRAAFVSALTTAVGFASLVVSRMEILREFGLYLAAGVMAAFVVECAIIPALLVLAGSTPHPRYLRARARGEGGGSRTQVFAQFVTAPRVAPIIVGAGVLLVIGSLLVSTTAKYDYALSDALDPSDPISQGNQVIDERLSGIIPIEVSFQGRPGQFRDPVVLGKVNEIGDWLEREYGIRTLGLPALLREENRALIGRDNVPVDPQRVGQLLDLAGAYQDGAYVKMFVSPDGGWTRLRGFSPDKGGVYIGALQTRLEAHGREVLAGTGVTLRMTGEAPVAYDGMNNLTRELVSSTFLALVFVVLAIALVFRNVKLALVAVIPNLAPVILGMAVYTLTNEVLDPLPGVVFCIAMGLAADDTIHLINRSIELEASVGNGRLALIEALVTARKAMVSSSAILVAGFLALTLSGFAWNRQLGVLGSFVLVLALASDLVFGPAGLALSYRHEAWRAQRRRRRPVPPAGPVLDLRVAPAGHEPAAERELAFL